MLRICFLLSLFALACKNVPSTIVIPDGAVQRTIPLENFGVEISLYLPPALDSFATWQSDCCTGGSPAHGFWDRRFQIVQAEHGMCFQKVIPDSIQMLTIFHDDYPRRDSFFVSDSLLNLEIWYLKSKQWDAYRREVPLLFKGIENWHNGIASFFAFKSFTHNTETQDNQLPHETLMVNTTYGRNWLVFCFECVGSPCEGFAERMLPYARTLQTHIISR